MQIFRKAAPVVITAAVVGALGAGGGAYAEHLIGSKQIQDNSIRSVDIHDGGVHSSDLGASIRAQISKPGTPGKNGLDGAVYRVENYQNGGGGSATVACASDEATSQKYTAIAGGVQGSTVADQSASGFAVSSSFPGRMDWDTKTPKPNRLDGWIVLGNGQHTSTLKVWALCVPTTSIPVQQVDLDN
jgi:hypothetical protein